MSTPLWLAAEDLRARRVVELLREWRDTEVPVYFLRRSRKFDINRADWGWRHLRMPEAIAHSSLRLKLLCK